ncbi:MAG: pinensin family lanthipeptide [Bacteroidota bacterium]
MKKQLKLNDLKVKSFVTEVADQSNQIKGGGSQICASQFPLCVNTTFTQVTCILC